MGFAKRFSKHRSGVVGAGLALMLIMTAIFAPLLSPRDPYHVDISKILSPPSVENFLGTDHLGRDLFSRILYGARVSLLVGVAAVMVALFIGGILGLFAGYFGKWVDRVIMSVLEVIWAFPPVLLALAFVAIRGASLSSVIVAIGLVEIPRYARIIRSSVISVREKDYIVAARASGIGVWRIIFTHVLPNVMAPVIIVASLGIAGAIATESILSFLGLGMQPPTSSWGLMISEGQKYMRTYPLYSLFPGLMIMLIVFSFNAVGDGLRDAWDPRLKN
jgi:peptide/nickel transport system permease protein